jgi:hypothetical protein
MSLMTILIRISRLFLCFDGIDHRRHHGNSENSHVIYPMGKPMAQQLLCCKGFVVAYYNFTLYVSDLQHPRLLHR